MLYLSNPTHTYSHGVNSSHCIFQPLPSCHIRGHGRTYTHTHAHTHLLGGRFPCPLLSSGQFGGGKLQGPNWSEGRRQQLCAGAVVIVLIEAKGLVRVSHGGFSTQAPRTVLPNVKVLFDAEPLSLGMNNISSLLEALGLDNWHRNGQSFCCGSAPLPHRRLESPAESSSGGWLLRKEPCFSWSWPHALCTLKEHDCLPRSLQENICSTSLPHNYPGLRR